MKFAAAHYIFSQEGNIFKNAVLDLAKGKISDFNTIHSQSETAFTVFYNGILCPDFFQMPTTEIAKLLLAKQKEYPNSSIFDLLRNFIYTTQPNSWLVIENIDLIHLKASEEISVERIG